MTGKRLIKVHAPLPGFTLVSFGAGGSVKSHQTIRDERDSPSLVRLDAGMSAKRERDRPTQLKTERELGNIWESIRG